METLASPKQTAGWTEDNGALQADPHLSPATPRGQKWWAGLTREPLLSGTAAPHVGPSVPCRPVPAPGHVPGSLWLAASRGQGFQECTPLAAQARAQRPIEGTLSSGKRVNLAQWPSAGVCSPSLSLAPPGGLHSASLHAPATAKAVTSVILRRP